MTDSSSIEIVPTDPHVLAEGLAPTPFTADEIHDGCPDGHWVLVRTERDGETSFHRTTFEEGDDDGATTVTVTTDASGTPTGEAQRSRETWLELQSHAVFQADLTTVTPDSIRLPFGERECLRYEVAGAEGLSRYWFAVEHPGMPVRFEVGTHSVETIAIG